jgi:hypothetical protein
VVVKPKPDPAKEAKARWERQTQAKIDLLPEPERSRFLAARDRFMKGEELTLAQARDLDKHIDLIDPDFLRAYYLARAEKGKVDEVIAYLGLDPRRDWTDYRITFGMQDEMTQGRVVRLAAKIKAVGRAGLLETEKAIRP